MSPPPTTVLTSPASPPVALRARLGVILGSHTAVDTYAAFVPPMLGVLEVRCQLTAAQTAWLLGIGSLTSGLSQPLAAWLSDRLDSRRFGAAGLVLAAVCLSCIGLAGDFPSLVAVYSLGMIGVGIFHPVAAASMGQLADQLPGSHRARGVSFFFVAGMVGGITGSILAPALAARPGGFELLRYVMIPGLLMAALLQLAIGRHPHRHHGHHRLVFRDGEIGRRWRMVGLLYVSNVLRFIVNMALFYLLLRWAQAHVSAANPGWSAREVADAAAPINGLLVALVVLGMASGGLAAGALVRTGREKWPLVATPIVFAPAIACFGPAGLEVACVLAVLAGIGFASMIPVSISLGQRLLPHRTSLASALMLGGGWAIAIVGPALAEYCLHDLHLGLGRTFALTAVVLALAGVVCLPLRGES